LISHSDNSKLSNYLPDAKENHYRLKPDIDSLKQYVMMNDYDLKTWGIDSIEKHSQDMRILMEENMHSNYQKNNDISKAIKWFKETSINNKNLLARTLLCFDDYTVEVGRNKYNFSDFEGIRNTNAFKLYEEYVFQNNPKSLTEIIEEKLKSEELTNSYRYFFVKYTEVIEYCKAGNFNWFDDTEDNLIYLLESEKNTKNVAVELYTYLMKIILKKEIGLDFIIDNDGIYINIGFEDNQYYVSSFDDALVQLNIWNNNGVCLSHSLNPEVPNKRTRNYHGLKLLEDYKWIYIENSYYRFGKSEMFKFEDNVKTNLENSISHLKSLLKNGFKMKL
jgi:hypothetical protein